MVDFPGMVDFPDIVDFLGMVGSSGHEGHDPSVTILARKTSPSTKFKLELTCWAVTVGILIRVINYCL